MRVMLDRWYMMVLGMLGVMAAGCASGQGRFSAQTLSGHGVVFYCDGAGGGGITNWGPGVKKGLADAGFTGTFDEFDWETGLGVIADQIEAVKSKRAQAKKLANKIVSYQSEDPNSPVTVMGLSAGTAIAVYALEELPPANQVDTVVLLSSSVASDHNLTQALRHVRGDLYVTTSPDDAILTTAVPVLGSADRQFVGTDVAGLDGFQMPPGASPEVRRLYSKVVVLAWDPQDDRYGDYGGHTDTTKPGFIQHVIAPLVMGEGPRYVHVHSQGTARTYTGAME
jgi:pimeloyl-ACP methyl ester carboxylesterase